MPIVVIIIWERDPKTNVGVRSSLTPELLFRSDYFYLWYFNLFHVRYGHLTLWIAGIYCFQFKSLSRCDQNSDMSLRRLSSYHHREFPPELVLLSFHWISPGQISQKHIPVTSQTTRLLIHTLSMGGEGIRPSQHPVYRPVALAGDQPQGLPVGPVGHSVALSFLETTGNETRQKNCHNVFRYKTPCPRQRTLLRRPLSLSSRAEWRGQQLQWGTLRVLGWDAQPYGVSFPPLGLCGICVLSGSWFHSLDQYWKDVSFHHLVPCQRDTRSIDRTYCKVTVSTVRSLQ